MQKAPLFSAVQEELIVAFIVQPVIGLEMPGMQQLQKRKVLLRKALDCMIGQARRPVHQERRHVEHAAQLGSLLEGQQQFAKVCRCSPVVR